MLTLISLSALIVCIVVISRPAVTGRADWRATITPLASIIGSGFLVAVPLLAATVGPWSPLVMAVVVSYAFAVGWAIRINITEAEPLLGSGGHPRLHALENLSRVALGIAYVISVAFYLRLLSAFVLRPLDIRSDVAADALTTTLLVVIASIGLIRGLRGLESVELVAVTVKLGVIAALLAGLAGFAILNPESVETGYAQALPDVGLWAIVQTTAGLLLVVQGFETTRYLGGHYPPGTRVRAMVRAQLIAAGVYVAFVALAVPLFGELPARVDETAVIDLAVSVAGVLGPLILIAAIASQMSAAVADTAGGGEMLLGGPGRGDAAIGYAAVTAGATAVVWLTDVFDLIVLASRAFAAYYFLQVLVAVAVISVTPRRPGRRGTLIGLVALAGSLAAILVVARPAA